MSEPLPLLQTDPTTYERPTQAWVCGSSGPCRLGPDAKGRCRAAGECQPARKGEAWACSRPAAAGGPCSEGALPNGACSHPVPPCRPVRSLRSRRGLAVWSASALSVGALVCLVGGPWRQEAVSPGELTFKHGTVAQSCDACHTIDGDHPLTWLATALREHGGLPESRRCLNCHQMGDHALAAHSLSAAALDDDRRRVAAGPPSTQTVFTLEVARHWPGSPLPPPPASGEGREGELACAVCHHEHQGKDATLARLEDHQCQACHTTRFPRFGDGHPEFDGYPYHRRTALRYDHVSHLGRHYREFRRTMPEGKAPTSCLDCHEQSPAGRLMLVRGFDKTCASCHLLQIKDSSLGGIVFLNLPGLDVATLHRRLPEAVAVGEWPESASGDLSPFMRLLLSTDERFTQAEAVLDGKVDLRDLRTANDEQLRAVDQYAWAIKGLLDDLSRDAPAALSRRLEKALGERIEGLERSSLTGDLPQDLVRRAEQQWLPDLALEMAAHRAGAPLPKEAVLPPPSEAPPPGEVPSRWYPNDVDYSLRYRPKGHAGDFMRAWLDRSAPGAAPGSPGAAPLRAIFASLSDPSGPGRCTKCHSVESVGEGSKINWLARRETPNEHAFTKFAHVPHFSLLGEKGCQTCHVLNANADVGRGFVHADNSLATDPGTFESSFASMNKATCTTCHVQKAAGDSCLTCHNYHIGFHPPAVPKAPFPGADH